MGNRELIWCGLIEKHMKQIWPIDKTTHVDHFQSNKHGLFSINDLNPQNKLKYFKDLMAENKMRNQFCNSQTFIICVCVN